MIPISQTLPDVNLDEILASLDTDTRDYLVLLLNDGAQGLGSARRGASSRPRSAAWSRPPSTRAQINEGLAERRRTSSASCTTSGC